MGAEESGQGGSHRKLTPKAGRSFLPGFISASMFGHVTRSVTLVPLLFCLSTARTVHHPCECVCSVFRGGSSELSERSSAPTV
jgi:hypothetical protein